MFLGYKMLQEEITIPNTEVISRWTLELTPPILYNPIVLMPRHRRKKDIFLLKVIKQNSDKLLKYFIC